MTEGEKKRQWPFKSKYHILKKEEMFISWDFFFESEILVLTINFSLRWETSIQNYF